MCTCTIGCNFVCEIKCHLLRQMLCAGAFAILHQKVGEIDPMEEVRRWNCAELTSRYFGNQPQRGLCCHVIDDIFSRRISFESCSYIRSRNTTSFVAPLMLLFYQSDHPHESTESHINKQTNKQNQTVHISHVMFLGWTWIKKLHIAKSNILQSMWECRNAINLHLTWNEWLSEFM